MFARENNTKKMKNFNSYPISNTNGTEKKPEEKKSCSLGEEVEGKEGESGWRLKKIM